MMFNDKSTASSARLVPSVAILTVLLATNSRLLATSAHTRRNSLQQSSSSRPFGILPSWVQRRQEPRSLGSLTSCVLLSTPRGGDEEQQPEVIEGLSLDQKVHAAMRKLGLTPPPLVDDNEEKVTETPASALDLDQAMAEENKIKDEEACQDGLCPMPLAQSSSSGSTELLSTDNMNGEEQLKMAPTPDAPEEEPEEIAGRIAKELNVDPTLAWASLVATATIHQDDNRRRTFHEDAARDMIKQELDMIAQVPTDSDDVRQLVAEGFDPFFSRRALAFADRDMDNARAILLADQLDEEAEHNKEEQRGLDSSKPTKASEFKTVAVNADFDPTQIKTPTQEPKPVSNQGGIPKLAQKQDVVFEATAAQIQELVIESPVPVLLDVYADWCGPCKVLGPALEEMAIKAGGVFRLVKVNSDNEKAISGTLEVKALPTVFGIRDGKILNKFEGVPRSEDALKSFMMGLLIPGGEEQFDPPVTPSQRKAFEELSVKLLKAAGVACFPFSARERLLDRVTTSLEELVKQSGDAVEAEESARVLRSLFSNVLRDPYADKFRLVNLSNQVIAARIGKFPAAVSILRSVGFAPNQEVGRLTLGRGKKVVNVAPLQVARDCIEKWIDKSRYEVAAAARKRKDELDRQRLQEEAKARGLEAEEDSIKEEEGVDANLCVLKVRLDGKKRVHTVDVRAHDSMRDVLDRLSLPAENRNDIQITCVAKKLIIQSSDSISMGKSLRELGLAPFASLVINFGAKQATSTVKEIAKLSQRVAQKKRKKKGSHTMQSVGIYGKDDGAKGELVDGGGGVLYEQDVSDDESDDSAPIKKADVDSTGNKQEMEDKDDNESE